METMLTLENGIYAGLMAVSLIAYFTRQYYLRPVILLASLVIIGFLQFACPSPSGGLQSMLYYWGEWQRVIPFAVTVLIVLLPSFLVGKLFCGWVCHKGAVQEFLFQKKFGITVPHTLDKVLRYVKYVTLAAVIIAPLLFHYRLLNSSTQPFKVLFNLGGPLSAVIFMGIVAVSSLFIYRPFCRYLCPVGALLGIASKIGLHKMNFNHNSCTSCGRCSKSCEIAALTLSTTGNKEKRVSVDNGECIVCGECKKVCSKGCIS
jgi:polyferredoxin